MPLSVTFNKQQLSLISIIKYLKITKSLFVFSQFIYTFYADIDAQIFTEYINYNTKPAFYSFAHLAYQ